MSPVKVPNPRPELTVTQAVGYLKAFGKFFGYVITLVSVVWYLRGSLDGIKTSLDDIHKELLYKTSIGEVNHAFKTLGDQNRDVLHKDGAFGLLVPEMLAPPTTPIQAGAAVASQP